ncbi:hypothetical protein DUNSADRAFT_18065 [Dunaliella salina]|nr:hypothetical protein DUNSADRAFT_18065 [Dunaliella salina]|eukprot:KAF5840029.1 hypothetical protein DUNSADRAFT_18065 [Dunaliella salina]
MRAAQVIRLLCEYEGAKSRLVQAGGVGALLREASKNLSGTVRVEIVQALQNLLSGPGMQHLDLLEPGDRLPQPPFDKPSNAQLEGKDGMHILLSLMLAPESGHAVTVEEQLKEASTGGNDAWEKGSEKSSLAQGAATATAGGPGGKHGKSSPIPAYLGPPPLEFGKPQRSKPEDLQLAAASALVSSCTFCAASIERLVQLGGLQLLLSLLPQPPSPAEARKAASEAAAKAAEASAKAEAGGGNVTPPLQEKGGPSGGTGKGASVGGKGEQPQQQTDGKVGDVRRVIKDRWGRQADGHAVRLLGTLHEVLLFAFSAALSPVPRPSSESKRDKDAKKQQAAAPKGVRPTMEELGTALEHLLPPFSQSMSDEAIVQQNPNEPARSTSPLNKGRSKTKNQSPTPPSSSSVRGAQAVGRGQLGEAEKEGQQGKDAKAAVPPEPELVAPIASLLQLLIPYIAIPAPPTAPASNVTPIKPRTSKVLLGQNKAAAEPPSSQAARPLETGLVRPDVVHALKCISAATHAASSLGIVGLESVRLAVASAALMLPESEFMVSARPPLPSPPPTPPPQPLATSVFLWDALDRPQMTDGSVKLAHIA